MERQPRRPPHDPRTRLVTVMVASTMLVVLLAGCATSTQQTPAASAPPTVMPTPPPTVTQDGTATQSIPSSTASGYRFSVTGVEGARFPRSLVTITLAIERVDTEGAITLRQWETPLTFDLELQGLSWAGEYMGSVQPTGDRDNPTIVLNFEFNLQGHPDDPVEITLNTLRFTDRSGERPQSIPIEDRWHLRFVPSELEV